MKSTLAFIFFLTAVTSGAQTAKPTPTELLIECRRLNEQGSNKQLVLWMPYNFWELMGEREKASQKVFRQFAVKMKDYVLFCVADYTTTAGGLSFKSDEDIRRTLTLTDSSNKVFRPLAEDEVSPEARVLLQDMQPMLAQMLGQFGEGMRLYLFKAEKVNGEPVLDIAKANRFTLSWNNVTLTWKLPLAVALPPKKCPVDKEPMKGNWNYCPEHGTRLEN